MSHSPSHPSPRSDPRLGDPDGTILKERLARGASILARNSLRNESFDDGESARPSELCAEPAVSGSHGIRPSGNPSRKTQ
jgi:hypothetical protein